MTQVTYYCTSSAPTLLSLIVRSRGLVKRWQDDSGNLLLHQFSPYFFLIDLVNEETPTPGYNRLQIKKIFLSTNYYKRSGNSKFSF
jgi:hypothetical protein